VGKDVNMEVEESTVPEDVSQQRGEDTADLEDLVLCCSVL
jgi:hypothetical protein